MKGRICLSLADTLHWRGHMGGSRRQTRHMFSEEAEVSASGNKVSIEQKVRTTLLRAGHGRRRDGLYEAYRQAVSEGQDGWALLVRAFIYCVT